MKNSQPDTLFRVLAGFLVPLIYSHIQDSSRLEGKVIFSPFNIITPINFPLLFYLSEARQDDALTLTSVIMVSSSDSPAYFVILIMLHNLSVFPFPLLCKDNEFNEFLKGKYLQQPLVLSKYSIIIDDDVTYRHLYLSLLIQFFLWWEGKLFIFTCQVKCLM